MTISRKCPKCSTWNGDNDYCTNCNHLLNYQMQLEQEDKERDEKKKQIIPDPLEKFFLKWKASNWMVVRVAYYIFYSIWFAFFAFMSFILWLILMGPG